MPVEEFEKRYLLPDGALRQTGVLLARRPANEQTVWWCMDHRGKFGRCDLRLWRLVKAEPHDGVPLDDVASPTDDEKGAINQALDDHLHPPPARIPQNANRESTDRGGDRGTRERRGNFRQNFRERRRWVAGRAREAGPSRVSAVVGLFSGLCWKLWHGGGAFIAFVQVKYKEDSDTGKLLRSLNENTSWITDGAGQLGMLAVDLANWSRENWDTALWILVLAWVVFSMFFAPSDAGYQTARFRDEERRRDEEERRDRER
jgi:hypothetical protein